MGDLKNPKSGSGNQKQASLDLHYRFHEVLGHVTTIRVALWQIKHNPQLTKDDLYAAGIAETHIEQLLEEIDRLKKQCYKLVE